MNSQYKVLFGLLRKVKLGDSANGWVTGLLEALVGLQACCSLVGSLMVFCFVGYVCSSAAGLIDWFTTYLAR